MIVWSGLGFLVMLIFCVLLGTLNFAIDAWWGAGYHDAHNWHIGTSMVLTAIATWFLNAVLRKRASQGFTDDKTIMPAALRGPHTLFFISMHIGVPILAIGGFVIIVIELLV